VSRLNGRVAKLEKILIPPSGITLHCRILVEKAYKPLDLANSTCDRRLNEDGVLKEIVHIEGHLDDEELERFIESFPIREARCECWGPWAT
jgi:hypothetical protein